MSTPITNAAWFNYDSQNPRVQEFLKREDQQYRVFSGADMTAYIGNRRVGKLAGITCSTTREVVPVYTWGDPNPKAFVKGKRGIAGSLVFSQFDRHAILRDLFNTENSTLQDIWSELLNKPDSNTADFSNGNSTWRELTQLSTDERRRRDAMETRFLVSKRKVNFVDMIPPFDVTITMVNELGDAAVVSIHGVQLVNEGWGYTLDDLTSEVAYTYLARSITPLVNLLDNTNISSATIV